MTQQQRITLYLGHVIEAIDQIMTYIEDMNEATFLDNRLVQDAVIRKVAPEFAASHPEVPWGDAIGNRNALSQGYFRVDFELVWKTICNDLPSLKQAVSALLI